MAEDNDGMLKIGGKFGDYDVIKLLGRGGMGEVYLLRSPVDGEFYAAKIMFPPKGGDAHEMRRRFANEASIAMKVLHKNLIRVYDVGEDPDTHLCYIIMEYLGGGSLADRIKRNGRLPVRDAVGITMEVALALEASHRAGIIHRDIKPDNILFADDGTPKLVDLGIAKFDDGSSTTMTMTGVIIGTPAYMAPEQMMDSHNVDARADVYSLGVVLYEMLSGNRPNSGSTAMELLAKAVRGEELPDVRTLRPEVSATLGYVLSRMTAVKAENRIASAIEAAKMLRDAFTGELRPPLIRKRPSLVKNGRRVFSALGIAAASVAFATLLFFAVRGMRQPAAVPQAATNAVSSDSGVSDFAGDSCFGGASGVAGDNEADGKVKVLFSRLDRNPKAWAYSFSKEQGWTSPDFDDSRWKRAQGGFGKREIQSELKHARINTEWNTSRIYLRRHFNWSGGDITRAVVDLFHDDDAVLYLNGKPILTSTGANFDWLPHEIPADKFAAALRPGDNVFCAEVMNRVRCAYFDCGLLVERGGMAGKPCAVRDGIRKIKTSAGTWTVKVANGVAQIGNGQEAALSPLPTGTFEIPSSLDGIRITRLAARSFIGCDGLKRVKIQEGIRAIDSYAFLNCRMLESVDIPDTVEWLGSQSFCATSLRSIDIKNVRSIDGDAFRWLKLDEIKVSPGNPTYFLKDGVLYDRTTRSLVLAPRSLTEISFPDGVEGICECAFQRGKIRSVVLPETIVYVGHSAFQGCDELESVEFKCADARIDGLAFGHAPKLSNLILPYHLRKLDGGAVFEDAGQLESVDLPETVECLGDAAFKSCRKLRNVTLGKSLKTIRVQAFSGCSQLESIVIPSTVDKIGDGAFSNCSALKTVRFMGDCPTVGKDLYKESNPSLATEVERDANGWEESIDRQGRWPLNAGEHSRRIRYVGETDAEASARLGKGARSDRDGVCTARFGDYKWFYREDHGKAILSRRVVNGSKLPCVDPKPVGKVVIPKELNGLRVTGIGEAAFESCGELEEVEIPDTIETIEMYAFARTGIKRVSLPGSIKILDSYAFDKTPLEYLDIGRCGVLNMPSFAGCKIKQVDIAKDNPNLMLDGMTVYSRDGKKLVRFLDAQRGKPNIRSGVETLAEYAFSDVRLDEEALTLPEGIRVVGTAAFWYQMNLKSIVFPRSLERIDPWILWGCAELKTIRFLGDAPQSAPASLATTPKDMVIEVERGSKGWNGPGSTDLPERWPVNAGDLACPIRYVGETEAEASARLGKLDAALPMSDGNATVLFPRLDRDSNAWAYSFSDEKGWTERDFDDSRWNRAQGGFGKRDVQTQLRHARINTEWKSGRIFLRRHFNWSGGDVSRAVVDLFHDDDVVLYLNGTRILQAAGADFDWLPREIPVEQFAAALRTGDNVFCAEVVNKGHCAYFDCGLLVECGGEVERPGSASDGVRKVKTAAGTWTVKVANGAAQIGDGQGPALSPLPSGHLEIPSVLDGLKIKRLAARSFRDCKNLKSVKINEGVRAIDYQAFCNCNALESLDIPETLEWIGGEALSSTALKSLDIKNVRVIDGGVFRNCKRLNEMKANPGNLTYFLKDGVLYDRVTRRLVFAPRSLTEIKFPRGIEGIYECAFQHGQIKSVAFPETVNYVGHSAFNECTMLESVEFKCEDARIDGWAFGRSPKLAKVVLPSRLTKLDDWSIFEDDGQLESVELPDTVEVLGDSVFKKCRKLRKVTLGKSLKTIRHRAFNGCSRLESVTLPPTVEELGDGVFSYCPALKTVRFKGNCPKTGNDLYKESHPFLNTVVDKEAQGWAKVVNQRGRWPLDAGGDSRTVRYATKSELAAEDKAESARPKTSAGTREVPVGSVPIEFRVDVEKLRKRYKGRNGGKGDGRIVLGRLNVEDGTAEDVATWAWLNKDGTFTAAAIMAARNGIVFMKNGYEPLTVQVAEARQQWRDDVAVDLGTVTLRKLADDRTAAFSVTPVLPDGVDGGRLTLTLENRNPCGNDWGTVGREHPNCVVKRVDFRRGEKVTVPGCAPASHAFTIEAQGCPVYSGKINLSSGGNDAGERRLFRTKTAVFAIRPCDERGGQWVRRSVAIDGNNALLLKEGGDGYNNKCRFFFNAYTDSPKDVASHFGWGPNEYRDLGEMTVEELERREKAGESPADGAVKCGSRLTAGHIYRFAERYHWKIDLLVAFESYGDGSDEPVPDGDGIYTTHVNGYDWKYRLDGDGNATLCGPNETTPCVSPKPTGELVVPDAIHGHKVTTISPLAFRFCDKMTRIVLPAHLENLTWFCAGNIFSSCHALASIEISDSNARCASEGGALYTKDKKTLLAYPKSRDRVTLAKETTDIGSDAFSSCMFKTVELPEGIERVQSWAFCVCPNLEEVEFPKSLKSVGCTLFHTSPSLRSVVFRGDAPSVEEGGGESLFSRAPGFLTVKVERGSKGWNGPGTAGLPDRWPLGSVGGSRPIAYK